MVRERHSAAFLARIHAPLPASLRESSRIFFDGNLITCIEMVTYVSFVLPALPGVSGNKSCISVINSLQHSFVLNLILPFSAVYPISLQETQL